MFFYPQNRRCSDKNGKQNEGGFHPVNEAESLCVGQRFLGSADGAIDALACPDIVGIPLLRGSACYEQDTEQFRTGALHLYRSTRLLCFEEHSSGFYRAFKLIVTQFAVSQSHFGGHFLCQRKISQKWLQICPVAGKQGRTITANL
jgi:hypothetical protein